MPPAPTPAPRPGGRFAGWRRLRPSARAFLLGSALMGAARMVPVTLLPLYLDRLGLSKPAIGTIQAAESWGNVLIALPAVLLFTRFRTPAVLAGSSLVTAGGFALLPWLDGVAALWTCRLCMGLAWWLHYVAIAPFLYRHSDAEERPLLFALAEAVHTAGAVLAAPLAGALISPLTRLLGDELDAFRWVLCGAALLPAASALVYGRIREAPPARRGVSDLFLTLRRHRGLLARFVTPHFTIACGAALSIPFLGLYFQDRFGSTPDQVGLLFAGWFGLATFGYMLSPWLYRRLGFVGAIVAVEWASIPFFLLLAFSWSFPLAAAAAMLRGALMNSSGPVLKNFMMEVSPEGTREAQVALNSTAWGLAWAVGPSIGGAILAATGDSYQVLMLVTVGFYFVASLATLWLLGPLDPRRAPEPAAGPPA